jgi:lysine 6-dehydrogenase
MKFDFVVVGATGMQGRIVTKDLVKSGYTVLMCGRDKERIDDLLKKYSVKTAFEYLDLKNIKDTIKILKNSGAKIVINCAEGNLDLIALQECLEAGMHSVDLGSDIPMTKRQLAKGRALKKAGLIHITGCGSVPGIGNVMMHYAYGKFDRIDTIEVGFAWDSNMKKFVVPFSIASIMEEFTTYAPYMHNYKIVKIKPMDSMVNAYHRAIGREKEFKCGHHPETLTFYNFAKNKGVKNIEFYAGFPEHSRQVIQTLINLGFWSNKKLNFKGIEIWPDEFLTELLKRLHYPPGYTETENLWVLVKGKRNGKKKEIMMECIVPPLRGWEDAGCNIDTGMPASIIAQMIFRKEITKPGAYAPEDIVPVEPFFSELRKRKILVYENGKVVN